MHKQSFDPSYNEEIEKTLKVLRAGGIILYPTDTVWGVGCDALNPMAIEKIFRLKRRTDSKAMLMLVADEEQLRHYVVALPQEAFKFLNVSTPTSLILPNPINIPDALISEGFAGFRICREPFVSEICRRLGHPLVSTSANISGEPTPASFNEISDEIKNGVDYFPSYRQNETEPKNSSSVIKIDNEGNTTKLR